MNTQQRGRTRVLMISRRRALQFLGVDNLKPQPALAESWEQSPDGTSITRSLRKGVVFHTGRELTSDDVIYNLNRILDFKLTATPSYVWARRNSQSWMNFLKRES